MAKSKTIRAADKSRLITMAADVRIQAAEAEGGQPTFSVVAYTGGSLEIMGWDQPVAIDLGGMTFGRNLVANLDHDAGKRVGNVTGHAIESGQLVLSGTASAATAARDEVVRSAANGFTWEASIEAQPKKITEVASGEKVEVNGQKLTGPLYLVTSSTLKGFAFVSHGADDNTTVQIAASAAKHKGNPMDPELKKWIEAMGFVVDDLTPEQLDGLKANYDGQPTPGKPPKVADNPFELRRLEAKRRRELREICDRYIELRNSDEEEIASIEKMYDHAVSAKMTPQDLRLSLYESSFPEGHTVIHSPRDRGVNSRVIEAAICQSGRLDDHEKLFDDQTLQAAHDRFRGGIGLKQLFLLCAEANGYRANYSSDVTIEAQRAAFRMTAPNRIQAQGWSTLDIATILSNTANKFLRDGWMSVDQTPLRIAAVRSVRDFKTITTVSLTGDLQYQKLAPTGEIQHGTLGEVTYTNKADTYARMLAVTRTDIINDDLGALTAVPRRLGRGAMLLLNHIFWTEFLNNGTFFVSTNSNHNEGVADMTLGGLSATELIFMNQTDPDGKPLGVQPAILLVPTALKAAAMTLMNSERLITGENSTQPDANIWRGRFRVESSPYMHNTAYTGYSASAWYMLAEPNVMPVIEIAALNGRVEPTVETADADFNVLGVQMRGYSDVGVAKQEYRGGVRADGGSS